MLLKEFVKETIEEIMEGVGAAVQSISGKGQGRVVRINTARFIEFDVAVTTTENARKEGHAGIAVWKVGMGGATESETTNTAVSRIKFAVPVDFPASN